MYPKFLTFRLDHLNISQMSRMKDDIFEWCSDHQIEVIFGYNYINVLIDSKEKDFIFKLFWWGVFRVQF